MISIPFYAKCRSQKLYLFFTAFVLLSLQANAQLITVSGIITDSQDGTPLVGATIAAPEVSAGAYSRDDGSYSFNFDPKGKPAIMLRVQYVGYEPMEQQLQIRNGNTLNLDFKLIPKDLKTGEVVITGTKGFEQKQADLTMSIQVVKQDAISLQASYDITKSLVQVPGVEVMDDQVSIRGSSGYSFGTGSRVMVMLNGLPLLTGDASIADLSTIPVDNIHQVEVMKGASSVLYGSGAMGGVVNVIAGEAPDKPMTSVRLTQSVFDTPSNKALDWDGASAAYITAFNVFHSRKIGDLGMTLQLDLIKDSGYRQFTEKEEARGFVMLNYTPKKIPGLTLGLNVSTRFNNSGATLYWDAYHPDTTLTIRGSDTLTFVHGGALTPAKDANRQSQVKRLAIDPTIKYLTKSGNLFWYRGRYFNNASENSTNQSSDNMVFYNDFLFQTRFIDKINFVAGATYRWDRANSKDLFGGPIMEGDSIVGFNDGIYHGHSLGLYTQADAKFGKFNFNLGLRQEMVKIDTMPMQSAFIVRAGLNYEITPGTNVRGSFGQTFRVPSVAERYTSTVGGSVIIEPNPEIRPEYGYSWELGIRQGFFSKGPSSKFVGFVDLAGFQMNFRDMVEFGLTDFQLFGPGGQFNPSGTFTSVNIADAKITGLELTLYTDVSWARKWFFTFNGGVTYMDPVNLNAAPDSLQRNAEENGRLDAINPNKVDQPAFLKYRTNWLARGTVTLGYGPVSLSSNIRYRSFMESIDQYLFVIVDDLIEFREKHNKGEVITDFIFTYRVSKLAEISLNVANAFNVEYMTIPGTLGEQRKFSMQLILRL